MGALAWWGAPMPDEGSFVNPYTFIPFPAAVVRRSPPGHAPSRMQGEQRFTGSFTVTWELKSPMTLPARGAGESATEWGAVGGRVRVPGASVKGAVRSVHEALFAGCPRVVDGAFSPVYREPVSPRLTQGWRLAVVSGSDGGRATRVVLTDPTSITDGQTADHVRVDAAWVKQMYVDPKVRKAGLAAGEELPRSGDFIRVTKVDPPNGPYGRATVSSIDAVVRLDDPADKLMSLAKGGFYVVSVTDTAARDVSSRTARCYWTAAKVGTVTADVEPEAWVDFRHRVRHARDRQGTSTKRWEDVAWPPPDRDAHAALGPSTRIGERRRADGQLLPGDAVWVRVVDSPQRRVVTKIKLAQAWRDGVGADDTLGGRLRQGSGDALEPCTGPELCLSCVIFGSVDETGRTSGQGRQDAYGAHVRFGTAVSVSDRVGGMPQVVLAPLGVPHPGAGMFYLQKVQLPKPMGADFPSRWGEPPDSTSPNSSSRRPLRGRKFYWHSDPEKQHSRTGRWRYRKRDGQSAETSKTADLVDHCVGADGSRTPLRLVQTVTFDGLELLAVQTLLAAFEPGRYLGSGEYAHHLGGGKPLGLGTATATITDLRVTSTAERYCVDPADRSGQVGGGIDAGMLRARVGDVAAAKAAAKVVLDMHGLGEWEPYVSYPTTKAWRQFGTDAFDEAFSFFSDYDGRSESYKDEVTGQKRWRRRSWRPLPDATDESPGVRGLP